MLEPWAHGTVVRATRCPSYYSLNLVRVEDEPGMSAAQLESFADEALGGLGHRRVDFDDATAADARRADFAALGWIGERLLWMRHDGAGAVAGGPEVAVEEVPYEAVRHLREIWSAEIDIPEPELAAYLVQAREVALRRGALVLAVREDGEPVAYAQLERAGASVEIAQVFVAPQRRGSGLGTALTRAAIEAAGDVEDLWICADDEDRPKQLYARLGFRPARTAMEFLRVP